MTTVYRGACFCGAVRFEVTGEPRLTGYCHCEDCRAWSGAPINAFSIWRPEQVTVTAGAEHLAGFAKTPQTIRKRCAICGGAVMNEHPEHGYFDVFAALLEGFEHRPALHVYYGERMIDMPDGLPKFRARPGRDRSVGDMPET